MNTLIRHNPYYSSLVADYSSILDDFSRVFHSPVKNWILNDKEYCLTINVPGYAKNDITVEIYGDYLIVTADNGRKKQQGAFYIPEDAPVDANSFKATVLNGQLKVTVPQERPKTVKIKVE